MLCPACRTAYQGIRLERRNGTHYVICPVCGPVPYKAVCPEREKLVIYDRDNAARSPDYPQLPHQDVCVYDPMRIAPCWQCYSTYLWVREQIVVLERILADRQKGAAHPQDYLQRPQPEEKETRSHLERLRIQAAALERALFG